MRTALMLLALFGGIAPGAAQGAGDLYLSPGLRTMQDRNLWSPAEDHLLFGILADYAFSRDGPFHLAAGAQLSWSGDQHPAPGVTVKGSVSEWTLGFRMMSRSGFFRPYFGLGLARVAATVEDSSQGESSDGSLGMYGEIGAVVPVGKAWRFGVNGRSVNGTDIRLFGVDGDADSFAWSLLMGAAWE